MLSVGGFAVYRSVTRGAEDNAAKTNVDRVLAAAEDYWQQFALNRDGTRKVSFPELCDYMNSQFTVEDDLILRSGGLVAGAGGAAGAHGNTALAKGTAFTFVAKAGTIAAGDIADRRAQCVFTVDAAKKISAGANGTAELDVQFLVAANNEQLGMSAWQDSDLKLGSNRGIFMMPAQMFLPGNATTTAATGWNAADPVAGNTGLPVGTDPATEAFVVGVVGSSGNTFCAVKVFDADDRSHIGNYRYALTANDKGPRIPQACINGLPPADAGEADSGWKAAS